MTNLINYTHVFCLVIKRWPLFLSDIYSIWPNYMAWELSISQTNINHERQESAMFLFYIFCFSLFIGKFCFVLRLAGDQVFHRLEHKNHRRHSFDYNQNHRNNNFHRDFDLSIDYFLSLLDNFLTKLWYWITV